MGIRYITLGFVSKTLCNSTITLHNMFGQVLGTGNRYRVTFYNVQGLNKGTRQRKRHLTTTASLDLQRDITFKLIGLTEGPCNKIKVIHNSFYINCHTTISFLTDSKVKTILHTIINSTGGQYRCVAFTQMARHWHFTRHSLKM